MFQESCAAFTLICAVSAVKGGYGARPSCAAIMRLEILRSYREDVEKSNGEDVLTQWTRYMLPSAIYIETADY